MPPAAAARTPSPILRRCRSDEATRVRLKYNPYYLAPERQQGATVWLDGREMVMLASNDYLGLSFHPRVIEAGQRALTEWGTSTTGARSSNGSRACHERLEEKLAAFLGREACHIHSAGYLSCLTSVATFATRGDVVLADRNIHSCLWDGIRLSGATIERFTHNDPADLRAVAAHLAPDASRLLVLEGVYSMEGHIAPLPALLEAAGRSVFTVLDDAHGFGVLGRGGRGTADHFGVNDRIDVLCGSMSKALASTGGFVAGSRDVIEYLRTHSRQTIFSAAPSPAQTACAEAALEVLQTEPEHYTRLWNNTHRYRAILHDLGLDTWGSETPAVPIVLGTRERAYLFWQALMEKGVFGVLSIAPAVPAGKDLVRTAVSALHTDAHLDRVADALAYARRRTL